MTVKELDEWYFSSGFEIMERITDTRYYWYSDEDGYQEFVDVCDNYWKSLKKYEKMEYYEEYKHLDTFNPDALIALATFAINRRLS